jgi:hypothetical protein
MPDRTHFFTRPRQEGMDRLEGKYSTKQIGAAPDGTSQAEGLPLKTFAGQFWWVVVDRGHLGIADSPREVVGWTSEGQHQVMLTEEIADTLDAGLAVQALGGPFTSRREAELRLDLYCDAVIMGHDDDDDD